MSEGLLSDIRKEFHRNLCAKILGHRPGSEVYNVADGDSDASIEFAKRMAENIGFPPCLDPPKSGQAAGALFTAHAKDFLEASFARLQHLRPGRWIFSTSQKAPGIAGFDQYEHLAELTQLLVEHKDLRAALGGDYLITPDIIVAREPVTDSEINTTTMLLGNSDAAAKYTPLRRANQKVARSILHASISCKWTMRSDRAQNTRTEALNLVRNRKGKLPHIAAVTLEPLPTRLAAIAMGTGDVDCTYHAALYELTKAVIDSKNRDQADMLMTLINGRRLRDICDLPFDLAT